MSIQLDNGTGNNPAAQKKAQIENACTTAQEFCNNFFDRIDNKRHTIEKLYLPTATLSWNGNKVEGANTIQKFLLDKIPSKSCHRLLSMDAQPIASTFTGGQTTILVQVAGSVQYQNVKPKPFQQNFLLTAQGDYWKSVAGRKQNYEEIDMALMNQSIYYTKKSVGRISNIVSFLFNKHSKSNEHTETSRFKSQSGYCQLQRTLCTNKTFLCDSPYPGSWTVKKYSCIICGKSFFDINGLNMHITRQHTFVVTNHLRKDPIHTYKAIFGIENFKGNVGGQLDFKDALTVTLKGQYAGMWKCWSDGSYGGPIKAIMRVNPALTYADAVKAGADIAGLSIKELKANPGGNNDLGNLDTSWTVIESRKAIGELDKAEAQRKLVAQEIWSKCIDLEGTLGEIYLVEHRHIPQEIIHRLEFKYLPHRSMWETISYTDYDEHGMAIKVENITPSLVVPVKDLYGNVSGVQRIFLDKMSGGKPKNKKQNKFSKGLIRGGAGVVQTGQPCQTVFVAEGPETGASIASVVGEKNPVLVSLSIMNFESMADVILSYQPKRIVLTADNDAAKENSCKILNSHVDKLKAHLKRTSDIPFFVVKPELNGHEKQNIDWNDVLVLKGIDSLYEKLWSNVTT